MSYGFEVYDSTGTAKLNGSMSIARYVGQYTGSVAGLSYVWIPLPGMAWDGYWYGTVTPNTLMLSVQTDGFYLINNSYPNAGTISYTATIYRW